MGRHREKHREMSVLHVIHVSALLSSVFWYFSFVSKVVAIVVDLLWPFLLSCCVECLVREWDLGPRSLSYTSAQSRPSTSQQQELVWFTPHLLCWRVRDYCSVSLSQTCSVWCRSCKFRPLWHHEGLFLQAALLLLVSILPKVILFCFGLMSWCDHQSPQELPVLNNSVTFWSLEKYWDKIKMPDSNNIFFPCNYFPMIWWLFVQVTNMMCMMGIHQKEDKVLLPK